MVETYIYFTKCVDSDKNELILETLLLLIWSNRDGNAVKSQDHILYIWKTETTNNNGDEETVEDKGDTDHGKENQNLNGKFSLSSLTEKVCYFIFITSWWLIN